MRASDLLEIVNSTVVDATQLKNKHTGEQTAPVNFACIFSHNDDEFAQLFEAADELGSIVQPTPTGPLYHVAPIETCSGLLRLLKVRKLDRTRPARGGRRFHCIGLSVIQNEVSPAE